MSIIALNTDELRPSLVADLVAVLEKDQELFGDDEPMLRLAILGLKTYGESLDENYANMGTINEFVA